MKKEKFRSEVLDGHKGLAIEVPFDPSSRWSMPGSPLWRGRRGHPVRGQVNGVSFESCIVPRSKRFWMLVDEGLMDSARIAVGEVVEVTIEPLSAQAAARGNGTSVARPKRAKAPARRSRSPRPRVREGKKKGSR